MKPVNHDDGFRVKRALVLAGMLLALGVAGALGWATLTSRPADTSKTDATELEPSGTNVAAKTTENRRTPSDVPTSKADVDLPATEQPEMADDSNPQAPRLPDPFPQKIPIPAAAIAGAEWLNTAGPITWDSLRGKVVVLDFWTYCCINCMHVLPDLKRLEEKYPNQLVVIGVHSAKFETERDSQNIREAILRYEIKHPVINDSDMVIWRRFGVRAWPTLLMIDPEGNAVYGTSGEAIYEEFDEKIDRLVKYHRAKGTLDETPVHFELEYKRAAETPLRFPGKVLAAAASDRLFISDSNHNRIVITTLAGKLVDTIGTGEVGRTDGAFDAATFFRPQGVSLDGDVLYVADTENHAVRRIDLKGRQVTTVAGTGAQGSSRSHRPVPAKEAELNSPWDVCWQDGKLYIAMAGPHQIWVWDPESDTVRAYAGDGREDIVDASLQSSRFAQPSGLASDGQWLYVADSEGSTIRAVPFDPEKGVRTIVGTAHLFEARLFTFGDEDGDNGQALFQHPLGVAWADGKLYVADTYNNKIKLVDPEKQTSTTLLGDGKSGTSDDPPQFDEPGGLSAAGGKLYIADTNNHAIRVADIATGKVSTLQLDGVSPPSRKTSESRPSFVNARKITLAEQTLPVGAAAELRVQIELPDGYELNELAPMSYLVESVTESPIVRGEQFGKLQQIEKPASAFSIPITTSDSEFSGGLRVSLSYFRCRKGASGLCEIKSVIWELPVRVASSGTQPHIELIARESARAGTDGAAVPEFGEAR